MFPRVVRAFYIALLCVLALEVSPASASPVQVLHTATCATLQPQLDAPQSGASDEYRMTSPECPDAAYSIPAGRNVRIVGAPTRFTGASGAGPVFSTSGTDTLAGLSLIDVTVVGPPGEAAVRAWVDGAFSAARAAFIGAADQPGPGVNVLAGAVDVRDSLFRGNSADYGGGLWAETGGVSGIEAGGWCSRETASRATPRG